MWAKPVPGNGNFYCIETMAPYSILPKHALGEGKGCYPGKGCVAQRLMQSRQVRKEKQKMDE